MKASKRREAEEHLERLSQWGVWKPAGINLDFQILSPGDAKDILEVLEEQDVKDDPALLEELANLPDQSLKALHRFRDNWPLLVDPETTNARLIEDRDKLRKLWTDDYLDNHYSTVNAWLLRKWINEPGAWVPHLMAGVIRPYKNLGARLARAVTRLFDHMKVCKNPDCGRYFIARTTRRVRFQSLFCMAPGCRRYARNERSLRSYHAKQKRTAKKRSR